jgi:hypothetical protein
MRQRDRITKTTTTSRIALIGIAAATMMITLSMIGAIQLQEANAARPELRFCFPTSLGFDSCWNSMKDCRFIQENSAVATGDCHHQQPA